MVCRTLFLLHETKVKDRICASPVDKTDHEILLVNCSDLIRFCGTPSWGHNCDNVFAALAGISVDHAFRRVKLPYLTAQESGPKRAVGTVTCSLKCLGICAGLALGVSGR